MSPDVGLKKGKIETSPSIECGESLFTASRLQDVMDFDHVEASDQIQQWQEEVRILQVFKSFVLDAIHVVLTSGDWGPIPIFVDGQVVYLTKDNVDVLAIKYS